MFHRLQTVVALNKIIVLNYQLNLKYFIPLIKKKNSKIPFFVSYCLKFFWMYVMEKMSLVYMYVGI